MFEIRTTTDPFLDHVWFIEKNVTLETVTYTTTYV